MASHDELFPMELLTKTHIMKLPSMLIPTPSSYLITVFFQI